MKTSKCVSILISLVLLVNAVMADTRIILPTTQAGQVFFGEFSLDGTLTRNLGSYPGGTRDYTPDAQGNLQTYTGTFAPSLMSQNNGSWISQTFPGWSTVNNLSYGGIVAIGSYVYVSDMWTAYDGTPQGIVRFSTAGGAPIRFAESVQTTDLATEGEYIYALHGYPGGQGLSVYDQTTTQPIRSIPVIGYDIRSVAVKNNGEFFTVDWSGNVRHLSSEGNLLDTLTIPGIHFSDINIDNDTGSIALGAAYGQGIFITDESLDTYKQFMVNDHSLGFYTEFCSFQVVPEPSFIALGVLGLGLFVLTRRR